MAVKHIDIGKDFARSLGPRYISLGPNSGEKFREEVLEPAFQAYDKIVLHLDSISSYSASFFEEALGGLVRRHGYAPVREKIVFAAIDRAYLVPKIEAWMSEATSPATSAV